MIHITSSRETRHLWWRHSLHCTQSYQMSLISPDPSEADNLGNLSHLSPFLMIGRQQTGSSLPHSVSLRPEMITSWRWHRAPALLCGPQPQHICISNVSMCYRQNIVQHFNEKSCTRTVGCSQNSTRKSYRHVYCHPSLSECMRGVSSDRPCSSVSVRCEADVGIIIQNPR